MKRVTEGGIRPAADQLDEQARAAAKQVYNPSIPFNGLGFTLGATNGMGLECTL